MASTARIPSFFPAAQIFALQFISYLIIPRTMEFMSSSGSAPTSVLTPHSDNHAGGTFPWPWFFAIMMPSDFMAIWIPCIVSALRARRSPPGRS